MSAPAAGAVPGGPGAAAAGFAGFFHRQAPAIRAAIKTTLGCVLVTIVTMAIHVPHEAWSLVTVIVLSSPEIGASLQKGMLRIGGTLAGAALGLVLIDLFSQYPVAFSLVLFAISLFASYRAAGQRFPYAYLIGMVTLLIVSVQALNQPNDAEWIALSRCAEVMLGVMATVLVTLSIWPLRSSDQLHERLADAIADCRTLLTTTHNDETVLLRLLAAPMQQRALLEVARTERDVSGPRFERLRRATELAARVIDATLVADAAHRFAGLPGAVVPAESTNRGVGLLQQLDALAAALRPGGAVVDSGSVPPSATSDAHPAQGPASGGQRDAEANAAVEAGVGDLSRHVEALARHTPFLGVLPAGDCPDTTAEDADLLGMEAKAAWVDRARLLHAFKVALALQAALWFWAVFHLPAGMQGMVTVLIVSQKTLGASELRSTLRLLGAFVGGTIGIVVASVIIPMISSLVALLLVIAPIIFVCIWVNDGSKRYGYAGFQAAFAFVLTLVGGASPMPDIMAPIDRLLGVCIGVIIALTIMRSIAPVDAARRARRALARMLEAGGERLRRSLQDIAGGVRRAYDPAWSSALVSVRDEAATHLGELRDGTARPRQLAAELDPLLDLVSRFGAVMGALDRTAALLAAFPRGSAGGELVELGRAVEASTRRLAAAILQGETATRDGATDEALRRLEGKLGRPTPLRLATLVGRLRTCAALLDGVAARTAAVRRRGAPAAAVVPAVSG